MDAVFNITLGSGLIINQSLILEGGGTAPTRFDRMTLLRTIIGLDIAYSVHDAGEGSQRVSIGIGMADRVAFDTPALPNPGNASNFPPRGWVWRSVYRIFGFAADQPAVFTRRIDVDLGSRRKLDNGVSYAIFENIAIEGVAASMNITGIIRQLWLVG